MDAELCRTLASAKLSPYYRYTLEGLIIDPEEDTEAAEQYADRLTSDCVKAGSLDNLGSDRANFLSLCLLSSEAAKKLFPDVNSTEFLANEQLESVVFEAQKTYENQE